MLIQFQGADVANLPCAAYGGGYITLPRNSIAYQDYYQMLLLAAATNTNVEVYTKDVASSSEACVLNFAIYANP